MRHLLLLIFLGLSTITANAQRDKIGCVDKSIRVQAEQIKHDLKAQGLSVYKDAMVSMDPKEPFPVAVQLTAGEQYQFIFVGKSNANKLYFELFDGQDKMIGEKQVDDPSLTNFVVYSFVPQKSDIYLIVLNQKIKSKSKVCGSFTIMQQSNPEAKATDPK